MSWHAVTTTPDTLGESPFWHPAEQRLYWVDIDRQRALRMDPAGGTVEHWPLPGTPGCIAPARSGGVVLALRDGIYRARAWGGPLECIVRLPYDPATQRANDGRCDALGRLWVGTRDDQRQPRAGLYCVDARGGGTPRVTTVFTQATTGNGLAWSPDGATLYWADTPTHTVRAWQAGPDGWPAGAGHALHRFAPPPAGWQPGAPGYGGRPDGAAVDQEGNYWCALYEGGRIVCLAPDGRLLHDIATPVPYPTMPCFGGPDGRTLYLATARGAAPVEQAGCVFARRMAVPGLPVSAFDDGA